ncbi:MAG TPA: leucine/isoleucine/valine transporter permease subunit, partial [Candidatus Limnocylindria bacterium]
MSQDMLRRFYLRAAGLGSLAAVVTIYLSLIGMVERFQPRNVITGVLTLGLLVPAIAVLIFAYRSTQPPRAWGESRPSVAHVIGASGLAGVVAGLLVAAFVIVNSQVTLSGMLINATPRLENLLTVGTGLPAGALLQVAAGAALGLAAAALRLMPGRLRRPLVTGLLALLLLSLMEPFMRVVLLQLDQAGIASWLYQSGGMTVPGAVATFVVVAGISAAYAFRGEAVRGRVRAMPSNRQRSIQIGAFVLVLVVLLLLPQIIGSFLSEVVGTVGLYILMGLGLNIVVGYAGLLDLGYVAFFAIGAYATAILTSPVSAAGVELGFWVAIPIVMLIAAVSGILIGAPVLRLRGDYLAIVTLGIGEIVRILLLSDALRPLTGGAQGILQVPPPELLDIDFFRPQNLYYPILAFVLAGAFVATSLA